ncbi:MAG: hypothetical protein ABIG44_17640 [Planctomycetota bacterium]
MMAHRYPAFVRFLTLIAALPWPAFLIDARAVANAPAGTASAVVSASDNAAVITAVLADRKPIAKGERIGLDGSTLPVVSGRLLPPCEWLLRGGVNALQIANANHPSCAFLCRFLL